MPEISAFKSGKLASQIGKLQFTLCQRRPHGSQFLALAVEFLFFRLQTASDLRNGTLADDVTVGG
jgi:hypothetical protein